MLNTLFVIEMHPWTFSKFYYPNLYLIAFYELTPSEILVYDEFSNRFFL